MTTPTLSLAEVIAEQTPGLLTGYLEQTARFLQVERDASRAETQRFRTAYQGAVERVTRLVADTDRFVTALKELANRDKYDNEFDDVLEEFGFERRTRSYRVDLRRDVSYIEEASVYVNATDEDAARVEALDLTDRGRVDFEPVNADNDYGSIEVESIEEDDA